MSGMSPKMYSKRNASQKTGVIQSIEPTHKTWMTDGKRCYLGVVETLEGKVEKVELQIINPRRGPDESLTLAELRELRDDLDDFLKKVDSNGSQ
jgi:hypothetical protein